MEINFPRFSTDHLAAYYRWAEEPHVKEKWFRDGYEEVKRIEKKLAGLPGVYPYVIVIDDRLVGYIQSYDVVPGNVWNVLEKEPAGTMGFDLFIGEKEYVGKGFGYQIVSEFVDQILAPAGVRKIIVDPFAEDKRAIRCYEKAGFHFAKMGCDDVGSEIYIMEKFVG